MKFLKLIPVLMILVFVSCSKEESPLSIQEEDQIETRRKPLGGTSNPGSNYPNCNGVTFDIISGMYNEAEDVICCNFSSGDEFLEVIAFGVDDDHDLEWNVQGTSIISEIGSTVLANISCPPSGQCRNLTFQIIDHTLKCKSTFNTEICNNTGPCFISPVDDCLPDESALECFCRKNPFHQNCDAFGGMN